MRTAGYIIGAIWSLPITLVGLVLVLVYGGDNFRWIDGVMTWEVDRVIGGTAAQTFGLVQLYRRTPAPGMTEKPRDVARLRRHEFTHTLQALFGGVVWAVFYALEFALVQVPYYAISGIREMLPDGRVLPLWKTAYRSLTWERHARGREQMAGAWGS